MLNRSAGLFDEYRGVLIMNLSGRKLKILEAIINDYIFSAEPIGSKSVSQNHDLNISAATIRNEMSDLEELGYLAQPHTSSGRIPTEKGYRLYVESMMQEGILDGEQKRVIDDSLFRRHGEVQKLLDDALRLMSEFTSYTAVALTPKFNESRIRNLQLVFVSSSNIMLIVVMESGLIRNLILNTSHEISQDKLNIISSMLNERLSGKTIEQIDHRFINYLKTKIYEYSEFLDQLLEGISMNSLALEDIEILAEGKTNILDFPEFNNISKARAFLDMLGQKDTMLQILNSAGIQRENINILIGAENLCDISKDCSILTATYKLGDKTIGKIGIIGPTRMDYSRVFSIMNYVSQRLDRFIKSEF